ncbi:MAG: hypothetical protein AB4290_16890 [Spirulina sp.]
MNPLELAQNRLQNSRDLTAQRTADRYYAPSGLSGSYAGHDSRTGEDVLNTPSGAIRVKSVSSGMSQQGEVVGVSLPRGGMAQSSQMPS